jgi:hypothetical protein
VSPGVENDILGQIEWFIMKIHHHLQHLQPILNINSFPKISIQVLIQISPFLFDQIRKILEVFPFISR